jgi:sphingomyelin phosphodiesterase
VLIEFVATAYCVYTKTEVYRVCSGAIKEMAPLILENTWRHYINPDFACPTLKLCKPDYITMDIKKYV